MARNETYITRIVHAKRQEMLNLSEQVSLKTLQLISNEMGKVKKEGKPLQLQG